MRINPLFNPRRLLSCLDKEPRSNRDLKMYYSLCFLSVHFLLCGLFFNVLVVTLVNSCRMCLRLSWCSGALSADTKISHVSSLVEIFNGKPALGMFSQKNMGVNL